MTARKSVALVASIVLVDLLSKVWIDSSMRVGESIRVIDGFFSITYVRNPGGAFGLFSAWQAPWGQAFFLAAATLTAGLLLWLFRSVPEDDLLHRGAILAILAGAVGNMIDRVVYGEVVDFLDVYVNDWHWPAFNAADIAITLGVSTLVYLSLFAKRADAAAGSREST